MSTKMHARSMNHSVWTVLAILLGILSPRMAEARGPVLPFRLPSSAEAERCLAARDRAAEAITRRDWAAAAAHYRTAIEAFPDSQTDWYSLACMLSKVGDPGGALRALGSARDLGRLYVLYVSADPDLSPLHGLPAFEEFLRSLGSIQVPVEQWSSGAELARSPDEVTRMAERAEARLAPLERVLGTQYGLAMASVARWKAASLAAMADRAVDPEQRELLRWGALRSLLDESMRPAFESLASDVLRCSASLDLAGSDHFVDALRAEASARWGVAMLDSRDEMARQAAHGRLRSDLLELAAGSADQPALEGVLLQLADLTTDDLALSSRIYLRLMAMASDKVSTRRRAQAAAAGTVLAVEGLPTFSATTTSGTPLSNSTLRGRVTLLEVWGTWCQPCLADLPNVRALHDDYREQGLETIGIAVEYGPTTDPDVFARWCAEHAVDWAQVLDAAPEPERVSDALGIAGVPYYLAIDASGRVVAAARRADFLRPALDRLLAACSTRSPAAAKAEAVPSPAGQ